LPADLDDVFLHGDDPIVLTVVTMVRNVHLVLVEQWSSIDVMFLNTLEGLPIPIDHLKPFDGMLIEFTGD